MRKYICPSNPIYEHKSCTYFMFYPTGDVSLLPDVSVELVVNIIEGFPNSSFL